MTSPALPGTQPVLCWYRVVYRTYYGACRAEDDTIMLHVARSRDLPLELEVVVRGLPLPRLAQKVTHVALRRYLPRCGEANF